MRNPEQIKITKTGRVVGGQTYDKFIGSLATDNIQVETPNGWIDVNGIGKTIEFDEWELVTTGHNIICADTHIVVKALNMDFINKSCDAQEIYVKDLNIGDYIITDNGPELVISVGTNGNKSHMYDLQIEDGSDHLYYTNGIVSHNSVWMHNIASGAADQGYNVLIVSLEMSEKKVVKRLGSVRLGIPVSEYDTLSKDREYIARKIEDHNSRCSSNSSLFDGKSGKIWIKEFPAASLTIGALEAYIKKLEDTTGQKVNMVLVDYIGIMTAEKSAMVEGNLYQKGKHLAEGLRSIAQKLELVMVTATQLSREKFGANDINLNDMPESKAIAETADTVFAIIRTPVMKVNRVYHLKALKLRDSEFIFDRISFDFDTVHLRIHNDTVYNNAA